MGLFDGFQSGEAEDAGTSDAQMDANRFYNYAENTNGSYSPSRVSSNAGSWEDVFKFGLSRAIDAKFAAPVAPQNAVPRYVGGQGAAFGLGSIAGNGSVLPWLLLAGVVVAVAVAK